MTLYRRRKVPGSSIWLHSLTSWCGPSPASPCNAAAEAPRPRPKTSPSAHRQRKHPGMTTFLPFPVLVTKNMTHDPLTFSALERMQRMKKGSALLRVSNSLVREFWGEKRIQANIEAMPVWENVALTAVVYVTWNWALMLGVFFFLCRWSRDLVVRSWRVRLTISFRERESSKLCRITTTYIHFLLVVIQSYKTDLLQFSSTEPDGRFTFGMACFCLMLLFFLSERRRTVQEVSEALQSGGWDGSVDEMCEAVLVWVEFSFMRGQ